MVLLAPMCRLQRVLMISGGHRWRADHSFARWLVMPRHLVLTMSGHYRMTTVSDTKGCDMAYDFHYLGSDSNGVTTARALAELMKGGSFESVSAGPAWDAGWIRWGGKSEVHVELHPTKDEVVAAVVRRWKQILRDATVSERDAPARDALEQLIEGARLVCVVTLGDFEDEALLDELLDTMSATWPGVLYVENDGFYRGDQRVLATA